MTTNAQPLMPMRVRIGNKGPTAADVIDVPMSVDNSVEPVLPPASHFVHDLAAAAGVGRVERNQPVVGLEQDAVREGLDHRNAGRDFGKRVIDPVYRSNRIRALTLINHRPRKRQQISHQSILRSIQSGGIIAPVSLNAQEPQCVRKGIY